MNYLRFQLLPTKHTTNRHTGQSFDPMQIVLSCVVCDAYPQHGIYFANPSSGITNTFTWHPLNAGRSRVSLLYSIPVLQYVPRYPSGSLKMLAITMKNMYLAANSRAELLPLESGTVAVHAVSKWCYRHFSRANLLLLTVNAFRKFDFNLSSVQPKHEHPFTCLQWFQCCVFYVDPFDG